MKIYLLRRVLAAIPVMLVVATVAFVLIHLAPGDPASVIAGPYASAEDIARVRHQLGLDQPLPVQLIRWYGRLLTGDLGDSIFLRRPVVEAVMERLEPTLLLTTWATLIAVLIGVPAGVVSARHHNSAVDQSFMALALLGLSILHLLRHRGQSRRETVVEREEDQQELSREQSQADQHDRRPRDLRPRHHQHGKTRHQEPQHGQLGRRDAVQCDLAGDEREAPDHRGRRREEHVAGAHRGGVHPVRVTQPVAPITSALRMTDTIPDRSSLRRDLRSTGGRGTKRTLARGLRSSHCSGHEEVRLKKN